MFSRSRILLGTSLLLAMVGIGACGGSSDIGGGGGGDGGSGGGNGAGALGEQPRLTGQISGWNKGGGYTLQAMLGTPGVSLTSAPIDASGNFSIVLPIGALATPFLKLERFYAGSSVGCQGAATSTPTDYNDALLTLSAVNGGTTLTVSQGVEMGLKATGIAYLYVDRQVDQTGSIECPGQGKTTYDVHYQRGWNRYLSTIDLTSGALSTTYYTGAAPAGATWLAN